MCEISKHMHCLSSAGVDAEDPPTKVPVAVAAVRLEGRDRTQRRKLLGSSAVQATFSDGSGISSASWGSDDGGGSGSCCIEGLLTKVVPRDTGKTPA